MQSESGNPAGPLRAVIQALPFGNGSGTLFSRSKLAIRGNLRAHRIPRESSSSVSLLSAKPGPVFSEMLSEQLAPVIRKLGEMLKR